MVRTEAKVKRFNKLHQQDAEEQQGNNLYEVEKILDKKICHGKTYYLIKWVGYSTSSNSWEKAQNLTMCSEALARFENSVAAPIPGGGSINDEQPPQVRNSASPRRQNKTKKMKSNSGQ